MNPHYITAAELSFNFNGVLTTDILKQRLNLLPPDAFTFHNGIIRYHREFFNEVLKLTEEERESLRWWPSTKLSRAAMKERIKAELKAEREFAENHDWRLGEYEFAMTLISTSISSPYSLIPLGGLLAIDSTSLSDLLSRVQSEFGLDTPITPSLWKKYSLRIQYPFENQPASLMIVDQLLDSIRPSPPKRPDFTYDLLEMARLILFFFTLCDKLWLPELETNLFSAKQALNALNTLPSTSPPSEQDKAMAENRYSNALLDVEERAGHITTSLREMAERITTLYPTIGENDLFLRITIPTRFPTITPTLFPTIHLHTHKD